MTVDIEALTVGTGLHFKGSYKGSNGSLIYSRAFKALGRVLGSLVIRSTLKTRRTLKGFRVHIP